MKEVVQPTLLDVLYLICEHKRRDETLKDYLISKGCPNSNSYFKKFFDKSQRDKIDSNPSGDEFDVPFFFDCMPLIAEYNCKLKAIPDDVKKLIELLRKIKEPRNDLTHNLLSVPEAKVDQYAMKLLKSYMNDFLDLIGNIFSCQSDTDERKLHVRDHIDNIMGHQKRDYDNKYFYVLGFMLGISVIMNVKHYLQY